MELRHLRYFVTVAQAGNFTRAAEQLGISQPPLSQQIQRLEHEIGAPLLKRLTRSVELTAAGESLFQDACQILSLSDAAAERARSIARGMRGVLRIGFAGSTAFNPQVFSLLHRYRESHPDVELHPSEQGMASLLTSLGESKVDVAFIRLPCQRSQEFSYQVIDNEEMLVALPNGHPLSQNDSIALAELQHETLITFPQDVAPGLYSSIINACVEAGFTPILGQQSPQVTSAISMVATGFGYAIVPASLSKIDPGHVTFLPIKDITLRTQVALAWRRHSKVAQPMLNLL